MSAKILYLRQSGEMRLTGSASEIDLPPSVKRISLQAPPFDGALTAPLKVYFSLTRECELSCPMCFSRHQHDNRTVLTIKVVDRILEELAEMGVLEVRFTGGEPTLFPGFSDLVAQADGRGVNVSINTHGVYSAQKRNQLAAGAVREFNISLDGPAHIHDAIRGDGVFDQTVKTIRTLREASKKVRINTMLFRNNISYLKEILALAESLGVGIRFCPMRSIGGKSAREFAQAAAPTQSQWAEAKEQIQQMADYASVPVLYHSNDELENWADCLGSTVCLEQAKCAAWLTQLGIDSEGYVYAGGCIDDHPKSLSVGSVLEFSMKDLWVRVLRDTSGRLMRQYPRCAECQPATLWSVWINHFDRRWAKSYHLF